MIVTRRNVFGDAIDDAITANLGAGMLPGQAVAAATGKPPVVGGRGNLTQAQVDEYNHAGGYVPGLFDSSPASAPATTPTPSFLDRPWAIPVLAVGLLGVASYLMFRLVR